MHSWTFVTGPDSYEAVELGNPENTPMVVDISIVTITIITTLLGLYVYL